MTVELSSFVVAAIVAAFFLADRLGGQEQLTRRLYQVALAFALAFTVLSATTAFLRSDASSLTDLISSSAEDIGSVFADGGNNTTRDAASIRAGIGLALLLLGFVSASRWSTLPLGAALGGLLLLLSGGSQGATFDVNNLYNNALFGSLLGHADEANDIAHFVVMLAGTLLLLGFGYRKWEAGAGPVFAPAEP